MEGQRRRVPTRQSEVYEKQEPVRGEQEQTAGEETNKKTTVTMGQLWTSWRLEQSHVQQQDENSKTSVQASGLTVINGSSLL